MQKWTIIYYHDADNKLNSYALEALKLKPPNQDSPSLFQKDKEPWHWTAKECSRILKILKGDLTQGNAFHQCPLVAAVEPLLK